MTEHDIIHYLHVHILNKMVLLNVKIVICLRLLARCHS